VRPLLKASFALSAILGELIGDMPTGHRIVNTLIHLAAIVGAYALGRRVIATCLTDVDEETTSRAALAAAAVFGLHPLATEAVSYLSGRSMSLGALLAMASLYAYIRARTDGLQARWWCASLGACAGALLVRETAFVTPLLWLVWEWARSGQQTPPYSRRRLRQVLLASAVPVAVLVVFGCWILLHERYSELLHISGRIASQRLGEPSLIAALGYFASSFALLRYPSIDPQVVPHLLSLEARATCLAVAAALLALAWRMRTPRPELLFAALWLLAWTGPIYLFPIRYDAIAERHFYPVIWGAAFPLAITWARWMRRGRAQFHIAAAIAACVAAAMFTVTATRNADYRSEVALWEAARRGAPEKLRVLNNLGVAYMEAGRWQDARTALERAATIAPDDERVRGNLSDARRGRLPAGGWEPMSD
jgi:hypothetical protein